MCEAAEKDVLSGPMGGNVGRTLGLLALPGGDCRPGGRGRGPVLRVQVVSGRSTTHAAGESPGSSPKPRGGSPGELSMARLVRTPTVSRRRGWVHTRHPVTATPGLVSAAEHTPTHSGPQDAASPRTRRALARGSRHSSFFTFYLAWPLLVASILRKIIVANFKSRLLVPVFQQGHELKQ